MAGNSFGKVFKLTTFGESHCNSVGVIIDGFPPKFKINIDEMVSDCQHVMKLFIQL